MSASEVCGCVLSDAQNSNAQCYHATVTLINQASSLSLLAQMPEGLATRPGQDDVILAQSVVQLLASISAARIGASPQHPVGNGLLSDAFSLRI